MLSRLKFAFNYFFRGKHRLPPPSQEEIAFLKLLEFLREIFSAHGADAHQQGAWVVVNQGRLLSQARSFLCDQVNGKSVVQVDFIFRPESGRLIVESFAGIGSDYHSAMMNACERFLAASFHVLFSVLVNRACCDQVDQETWLISGTRRRITLGALILNGKMTFEHWQPAFQSFQELVGRQPLPPGLHWIRLFYSFLPGERVVEVLLNNEPWEDVQAEVAGLGWPQPEEFSSARLFFTIEDGIGE